MLPLQTFSLQNAQPQPQWIDEALLGARQGEETESGASVEPRQQKWDTSKAMTVYYSCLPSMFIKITHDGLSRSVGDGAWQMKEVFRVMVVGVYVTDRPETAINRASVPASGGPVGRAGYAA